MTNMITKWSDWKPRSLRINVNSDAGAYPATTEKVGPLRQLNRTLMSIHEEAIKVSAWLRVGNTGAKIRWSGHKFFMRFFVLTGTMA
ncbi:MAG: hypothetical protein AABZ84_03020 [Pseudomonadota bacterium]